MHDGVEEYRKEEGDQGATEFCFGNTSEEHEKPGGNIQGNEQQQSTMVRHVAIEHSCDQRGNNGRPDIFFCLLFKAFPYSPTGYC